MEKRPFRAIAFVALLLVVTACSTPTPSAASPIPSPSAGLSTAVAAPSPSSAASGAGGIAVEKIPLWLSPTVHAVLWRPASAADRKPVAIVAMHESADFTNASSCGELASRGFQMLCANGRFLNQQASVIWDDLMLDMKTAVAYLRTQSDIKKVFLFGHSGGGALMSYYQNVAENGVKVCQDPRRIMPCPNALADLPKADGVILIDPIPGLAYSGLTATDPAVVNDDQFGRIDPSKIDPSLDMFSKANGYDLKEPRYSADFVKRFHVAQGARYNELVKLALSRMDAIKAGKGWFPDDEPFVVNRANARLWVYDTELIAHTQKPHTIVTATGQREDIVPSVRPVGISSSGSVTDSSKTDPLFTQARNATVRSFLSTFAIRTNNFQIGADSVSGVDWESSNTSLVANVAGIRSPLLALSMTAHYWLVTTELAWTGSPSTDKTLAYIEGATHVFSPCKPCEKTPGQFGDTNKTTMDYVAKWISTRM